MHRPIPVLISAIVGITIIEVVALCNGIDGTILLLALASIAGIGGFSLARLLHRDTPPRLR
jgi:hypothetical protein